MKTIGSSFELIMDELLKQKQLLEALQTENDELYRRLAELREGRGIFIEILGNRFPLVEEPDSFSVSVFPEEVSAAMDDPSQNEITGIPDEAIAPSWPETPVPSTEFTMEEVPEDLSPSAFPATSASLEEALLDEFSNAATKQMAAWTGPITNPPVFDDQEKETLRRELSGSFLLE